MFTLKSLVLVTLVAGLLAQDSTDKPTVEIITERLDVKEDGYSFEFKTSDGTSRQEEAKLITVGEHQGIGVKGSYTYTAPDGQQYLVTYTADDKGYNPVLRQLTNKDAQ